MRTYKDVKRIGGGGYADVIECVCDYDGLTYAKKVLRELDHESVKRFNREVRILERLTHPNIVTVVDMQLTRPPYYFVMPRYHRSMADCFPDIIGSEQVVPLFSAVLDAMDYAHRQGVIHRDLKPSNILLASDWSVAVSDFGFGRFLESESAALTESGAGFGTAGYACPEQFVDAKRVDLRCDIYSLGIVLYELYAGRLMLSVPELDRLPPHIRVLVDRCLRHNPDERFQFVEELKRSWTAVTSRRPGPAILVDLRELAGRLAASIVKDKARLQEFVQLLAQVDEDLDAVTDVLLIAGPKTVSELIRIDSGYSSMAIDRFAAHAISQRWPADHSDLIGDFCNRLIDMVDDHKIRAVLLVTLIHVAAKHNRYKLVQRYGRRLTDPWEAAALIEFRSRLRVLEPNVARTAYLHVAAKDELSMEIREAFESVITGVETSVLDGDVWNDFWQSLEHSDIGLFEKLSNCVAGHRIVGRTVMLDVRGVPVEHIEYHVRSLERIWRDATGWTPVIFVMP